MEIIEVLVIIIFIITVIAVISFGIISIIIYIKDCTIKLFLFWILSYAISVGFSYLIDSEPILLYSTLFLIPFMASIFFILRIEERSFEFKYLFGFSISIILFFLSNYLLNPTGFSFFRELTGYLIIIFIFYFPKICIYNKLIKKKSIKYPLILIGIIIYLFFAALLSGNLIEFLKLLSYYFVLIAFLSIIFFKEPIKEWIRYELSRYHEENEKEDLLIKKFDEFIHCKFYYLFNWDFFTKEDSEKLRNFLLHKFHFNWIKEAEICKSENNEIEIIDLTMKENSARVIKDDKKKIIYLKLNNDLIYNLNVNIKEENGIVKIFKSSIIVLPIKPIDPTDHHLCHEIDDAILNDRYINFENINIQALRFMLVCANQRKDKILLERSFFNALTFVAFALAIPPLIEFTRLFSEAIVKIQFKNNEIYFQIIENQISDSFTNLFQINELFAMVFGVISIFVIFILIFYGEELFLCFKLLMKKYVNVDLIYRIIVGLIYRIIVGIIVIGFVIEILLYMEIKWSNVLILIFSILCMTMSKVGSKPLSEQLSRNYKIILNLNERIIFR